MRGAEFALQFEHPKLGAIATASMSGQDFASMLERAIRASNKEREVKALSKHARSRQIDQSFLLRVSFPLSALVEVPTFFRSSGVPSQRSKTISAMKLSSPKAPQIPSVSMSAPAARQVLVTLCATS
jgi:hypothetical protein